MKRYFYQMPGMYYAGNVYGNNKAEARVAIRKWLGLRRLPPNTAVWEG